MRRDKLINLLLKPSKERSIEDKSPKDTYKTKTEQILGNQEPEYEERRDDSQETSTEIGRNEEYTIFKKKSALKGFETQYRITGIDRYGVSDYMERVEDEVLPLMRLFTQTKVILYLNVEMSRVSLQDGYTQYEDISFPTKSFVNLKGTDRKDIHDEFMKIIEENIQKFNDKGSNWVFEKVNHLDVHFTRYKPLRGSSYIELPDEIKNKNAVINIKNEDDKCFLYCVARYLNMKDKNKERVDKELIECVEKLNYKGINFPVGLKDINNFEKMNLDISINVLELDDNDNVYPSRISKFVYERKHNINLLFISQKNQKNASLGTVDEIKYHYCLINNLSRLLSSKVNKDKNPKVFCIRCFSHFGNEDLLNDHLEFCKDNEYCKAIMPWYKKVEKKVDRI